MYISAIIAAGGQGKRMNSSVSKQFLTVKGHPILYYTLSKFAAIDIIQSIVLVVGKHDMEYTQAEIIKRYGFKKIQIVEGGKQRQDSVYNGLRKIPPQTDIVLIHDGVRPFVSKRLIERSIVAAKRYKAVGVAVPVKDTIKVVDDANIVMSTPDRSKLWAMQTPQCFSYDIILGAYEKARSEGFYGTDDMILVERMGLPVKVIEGAYENIKITTPEDMIFAETFVALGYGDLRR